MSTSPITVITGTPGAGKTLYVVTQYRNTPAFYNGITLTEFGQRVLPWQPLDDPREWFNCPSGSTIILDEAHRIFPQRAKGDVPSYILPFDQLRHQGLKVVLLTQHPSELDIYIRRRVGWHTHLHRTSGLNRATCYHWERYNEEPHDPRQRKLARTNNFSYDRSAYELYESAEVHTLGKSIPWYKLAMIAAGALLVALMFYFVFQHFSSPDSETDTPPLADNSRMPQGSEESIGGTLFKGSNSLVGISYNDLFTPEVPFNPPSAPIFRSKIMEVASIRQIDGCHHIQSTDGSVNICRCNDEHGTNIRMPYSECVVRIKNMPHKTWTPVDPERYMHPSQYQQQQQGGELSKQSGD